MKINITKKQYNTLVKCLEVSGSIYGVMGDTVNKKYKKFSDEIDELSDYVLGFAKEFDMDSIVDEYRGKRYVSEEYMDKIMDDIKEYDDYVFWDSLVRNFAKKEFASLFSEKEFKKMKHEEYLDKLFKLEDKYWDFVEDFGLEGLEFKDDVPKNKQKNMPKEKILPMIKLKYYNKGEGGEGPKSPDSVCFLCNKKNIAIGSIMDAYTDNPKTICEDCSIVQYQKENKFKTKEAASARRRRVFDVGYLFSEMITDKYLKEKNIKSVDDLKDNDMEKIMETGKQAYNELFSKKEKIKLEETKNQVKIEEKLKKKLKLVVF